MCTAAQKLRLLRLDALDPREIVEGIERDGAVVLPALSGAARAALLADAIANPGWRRAREIIGEGERAVRQRMDVCEHFAPDSPFHLLVHEFQVLWDRALAGTGVTPFEGRLCLDDLMLQRYTPGEIGITPHRDHVDYRNLVCLFVLCGRGRFCLCADRAGNAEREVAHAPGDVILTRAPGFNGSNARPFHLVRDIVELRYVFGVRQKRRHEKQGSE